MDELLIEDKKYVSSKRAAKMTGYAKDYIGQLCREGRVPARLVGRSWYVLETAIQDHRFGTTDIQSEEIVETVQDQTISPEWESPKYESAKDELLPSVNRLRTTGIEESNEEVRDSERLQDTWKTWFDRIADAETGIVAVESVKEEEIETKIEEIEKIEEEKPVDVPIHNVYRQPPEELLPRSIRKEEENEGQEQPVIQNKEKKLSRVPVVIAVQVFGILVAVTVASLAIVGSGYLDEYIISNSQVRILAGVGLYNK